MSWFCRFLGISLKVSLAPTDLLIGIWFPSFQIFLQVNSPLHLGTVILTHSKSDTESLVRKEENGAATSFLESNSLSYGCKQSSPKNCGCLHCCNQGMKLQYGGSADVPPFSCPWRCQASDTGNAPMLLVSGPPACSTSSLPPEVKEVCSTIDHVAPSP